MSPTSQVPPATAGKAARVIPYRRHEEQSQPPYLHEAYRGTILRSPRKPLIVLPHTLSEVTGPVFGHDDIGPLDNDLTKHHAGEPLGERITRKRPGARRRRPAGAQHADRNLAVQRRGTLRAQSGSASLRRSIRISPEQGAR